MRTKYRTIIIVCSFFFVSKFVSCEDTCEEGLDCFAFYDKFYVPLNSECDAMLETHGKVINNLKNFAELDRKLLFYKKLHSVTNLKKQVSELRINYTDGVQLQSFNETIQRIDILTGYVDTIKTSKSIDNQVKAGIQRNIRNKLNEVTELNRTLEALKFTIDYLGEEVEKISSSQFRWCKTLDDENKELNKLEFHINRAEMKVKKLG